MKHLQAIGIDLGTTYSCIAWLNEHGQPVTIPNQEGELSTPSVVFFDGDHPIVGTEALRNAIACPDRVVQHAKRWMGDSAKFWKIGDVRYSPVHISGLILRKLIAAAQEQIGEIRDAVITVPAQFSDAQRHATMQAGHAAGLERIEMINEPVAAALCHVLGNEGLAFTELAVDQQLLVYDLGGGTLDLAVVRYATNEVRVVASDGDLELGGLDFTRILTDIAAQRFFDDFGDDPRSNRESLQFLSLESEQAKRSLSVRPRAAITVQHGGHRKTYQIEQSEFEQQSSRLLQRSEDIVRRILRDHKFGWAHIDVVLTTGGASRMPMIRESLKRLSGRTLNTSLSPDQSIAHGAAYYAGMLLSNDQYARTVFSSTASSRLSRIRQQSVNARSLGILIRDETGNRVPHYLIPANTPLPVARTHVFGTVVPGQNRVHVRIVESGAGADRPPTVLGDCEIRDLPPDLPEGSEIEVTISYDHQARVHVSAREPISNLRADVEIVRQENVSSQLEQQPRPSGNAFSVEEAGGLNQLEGSTNHASDPVTNTNERGPLETLAELSWFSGANESDSEPVSGDQPVLLCNECGAPLGRNGKCRSCGAVLRSATHPGRSDRQQASTSSKRSRPVRNAKPIPTARPVESERRASRSGSGVSQSGSGVSQDTPARKPEENAKPPRSPDANRSKSGRHRRDIDPNEAEFWDLVDTD